uniref:NADH-ubiquinone oxidoreductase chain 5 n=1 Tax=Gononemertes parasita TaxID=649615 RepID=A0A075CFW9_9BILA|nr:NADH dehydrogenase subunit 5 [Gononemertes parasita]AGZ63893.1 NADH dehydrogenase subunit 5 [Gononemertes parasita]
MFFYLELDISIMVGFFLLLFLFFVLLVLLYFCYFGVVLVVDWELFSFCGVDFKLSILLDWISLSFSGVVIFISVMVVFFSYYYMFGDFFLFRFILLVFFFVFSMLVVIFIPNLIALLLGWDGLGLISFCLVLYYQNFKSLVSGIITVLVNRIGDVMILLSIGWLFSFGSWSFLFLDNFYCCFWVGLCLVLAGMTKSAQFPFCSWLPAAMAAPTPVSALVHSSTLVTAGVYLVLRFWEFISGFYFLVFFLFFLSMVTMFLSGFSALFETDFKKVIALSTLSQLSVMLFSISNGFCVFGLFHLYTHALFKALLFLCAGTIIHCFSHIQDFRMLGSCWKKVPCVLVFLNLANMTLCGFPFLGGFYSKDLVLEGFFFGEFNLFFFFFLFFSTVFTVSYSVRVLIYSTYSFDKGFVLDSSNDSFFFVYFPIFFLGLGAIFGGSFFFYFLFFDFCSFMISSFFFKVLVFSFLVLGSFLAFFLVFLDFTHGSFFVFSSFVFNCGCNMWFLQGLSTQFFLFFPFFLSFFFLYKLDRGFFEMLGGYGIFSFFQFFGSWFHFFSIKSVFFFLSFLSFFFLFFFIYCF